MDVIIRRVFSSLLIFSFLLFQSQGEASGSVFFIDSPTHQYFRSPSTNYDVKSQSMLAPEVGAAVSVLLGFAPPPTLSTTGSFKLNEILMPNPFDRPHAVFMLEVTGIDETQLLVDPENSFLSNALSSKITLGSDKADILLPGEDEVSVISLDEAVANFTDKEIRDFASWLGGSYASDAVEPLKGELTIPLAKDVNFNLRISKTVDRKFLASLLSLVHNVKRAIQMHKDFSQGTQRHAELLMGCFHGIKTLQEQYGPLGVTQKGLGLLIATLSKIFDSLQTEYKGQIVGVIFCSGPSAPESEMMLNTLFTSPASPRWLAEEEGSPSALVPEVILVRRTVAWLTGIILLIATLLGIYFLLNMPLTRDTLLYSNVKLD
ncbi:hypothetical protein CFOL_v3_02545 [Cephalotus follicularis]|uniref:DUF7794 domain-containing protein n=1 Tax=Cephalotus follicularis TaxID=3775 RepID=A0A1Q3ATW1_CEPFO|nr:hypothetical protein CFOL_v3_02545 [Cephalotus follicularis]